MAPCRVLDFTEVVDGITEQDLQQKEIPPGYFILLKTWNSYQEDFDFSFTYLATSGAAFLKERGVIGVGIDALGIERDQMDKGMGGVFASPKC